MYLITDRQVMKMNTFVFDEAEKKLRGQRVAPIIRDQSVEVGELIYKGAPPIASAQIVPTEGFIPQIVSKWARAFLKPEYLRGQIAEAPLMARAREVRRKVLDTFPTLKYLVEGR